MSDLRKQLNEDLNVATWDMLDPHLKRGALVEVDGSLGLVEVGIAIAEDKTDLVKDWMEKDLMKNVKEKKVEWEKVQFKFLILSPYVLMQVLTEKN